MKKTRNSKIDPVVQAFRLESLQPPVDVEKLARDWGVTSIERHPIESDAMLLPGRRGYSIIINENKHPVRQLFSFAHELGHLLLHKSGMSVVADTSGKHRRSINQRDEEEQLCDEIASEILMPSLAFEEDGWMEGWTIRSLRTLAGKYHTSIPATARRMIDLMPEAGVLGVWKLSTAQPGQPRLQASHASTSQFGVPSASVVSPQRMKIVAQAWESAGVHTGVAPVVDKQANGGRPFDVPAEALAWGQGEYKQVMVFYYPERERPTG